VKLLEIDSRGRKAHWTGLDSRGQVIAKAVVKAISLHEAKSPEGAGRALHLVKP
jgi:hypothetical protein